MTLEITPYRRKLLKEAKKRGFILSESNKKEALKLKSAGLLWEIVNSPKEEYKGKSLMIITSEGEKRLEEANKERKLSFRFWIPTIIAFLSLIVSIISLLNSLYRC